MLPFYVFFAAIGLGFLFVEISQFQRLGVFLGHPTYALTVVLFTVLVFSGIGSLLTDRFVRLDRRATVIGPFVGLLIVLAVFGLVATHVTHAMASETTPVRIRRRRRPAGPGCIVHGDAVLDRHVARVEDP